MSESKWWVEQRVHACGWGEGVVKQILDGDIYPIKVSFGINRSEAFAEDGKWRFDIPYPVLFPLDTERPKAKVKHAYDCWINVYLAGERTIPTFGDPHISREVAIAKRMAIVRYLGDPIHIVHEWEE